MNPMTVLITGANRGLGLGLVRHFLKQTNPPETIIATCRDPDRATELTNLAAKSSCIKIQQFDLSNQLDPKSLDKFTTDVEAHLGGKGLNALINNAGIFSGQIDYDLDTMTRYFTVNSIGPILVFKALQPLLKKGSDSQPDQPVSLSRACVVNITSDSGSITNNTADNYGGLFGVYRGSKAALNMLTRNLSLEHVDDNILFLAIHPGAVATDMTSIFRETDEGNDETWISVEDSARGVLEVAARCTYKDQGAFLAWNGETLPW